MKEIHSEKVAAGNRTYFFNVKETVTGDRYMVISEARQKDGGFEHQCVLVFDEHMEKFSEAFDQALWVMARREAHAAPTPPAPVTSQTYELEEIRRNRGRSRVKYCCVTSQTYELEEIRHRYPKAYEKWTGAEEEQLKREYQSGLSIPALAALLQRQRSAIQSRLRKLGLAPNR